MDELREKLFYQQKNGYDRIDMEERLALEAYSADYMAFLNASRTEREAVKNAVAAARERGFTEYRRGMELTPGTKLYHINRGKAITLVTIGRQPLSQGAVIAGAHVDSPRLDMKQFPLYEDTEMGYLRTHYYGGIKKFHWITIPLELHGVVALKNGDVVDVSIGREPGEPKFVITDLLPHLGGEMMKKPMNEAYTGEGLTVLIGSAPYAGAGKDRVRLALLSILNDLYGITEEDFLSAELAVVPSYEACEIGLDRSMIGGYGQDDKVCAYAALRALLDAEAPERTCVCMLADKEETGSEGVTGMLSDAFESFMEELCQAQGVALRRCFENSFCLSADVPSAFDPLYADAFEKRSTAKINYGVGILKYTGSRGKHNTNDASAESLAALRRILDENQVVWQMAELGKVDHGGGGTIAKFMAQRNIDTVDLGTPLLSMHAPFEICSKLDCYSTYKAIRSVFTAR